MYSYGTVCESGGCVSEDTGAVYPADKGLGVRVAVRHNALRVPTGRYFAYIDIYIDTDGQIMYCKYVSREIWTYK